MFTFSIPGAAAGPNGQRVQRIEHYWLCGECAVSLTLERVPGAAVTVLPLPAHAATRNARSAIAS